MWKNLVYLHRILVTMQGTRSPSFISQMKKELVQELLDKALGKSPTVLIDLSVSGKPSHPGGHRRRWRRYRGGLRYHQPGREHSLDRDMRRIFLLEVLSAGFRSRYSSKAVCQKPGQGPEGQNHRRKGLKAPFSRPEEGIACSGKRDSKPTGKGKSNRAKRGRCLSKILLKQKWWSNFKRTYMEKFSVNRLGFWIWMKKLIDR